MRDVGFASQPVGECTSRTRNQPYAGGGLYLDAKKCKTIGYRRIKIPKARSAYGCSDGAQPRRLSPVATKSKPLSVRIVANAPAGPCAAIGAVIAFAFPLAAIPLALFVPIALLWIGWSPKKTRRKKRRSWTNRDLEKLANVSSDVDPHDFAHEYLGRIERHEAPAILSLTDVDLTTDDNETIDLDRFFSRQT